MGPRVVLELHELGFDVDRGGRTRIPVLVNGGSIALVRPQRQGSELCLEGGFRLYVAEVPADIERLLTTIPPANNVVPSPPAFVVRRAWWPQDGGGDE